MRLSSSRENPRSSPKTRFPHGPSRALQEKGNMGIDRYKTDGHTKSCSKRNEKSLNTSLNMHQINFGDIYPQLNFGDV